jgi:hypothetical protein
VVWRAKRGQQWETGGSVTRGNSANGAVPTAESENGNFQLSAAVRFEFHKRSQLFIRSHNESPSLFAMRVSNPDCSPA